MNMHFTKSVIQKLLERDEFVTRHFFFEKCRPLFVSIINNVFNYPVDYDEFVNELYLHIMENDAARLKQFEGRSSIYQWLKVVAIRFFIARRDRMVEEASKEAVIDKAAGTGDGGQESEIQARIDIDSLLKKLSNRRYAFILRKLVLEDMEPKELASIMDVTVPNLYNMKKRAIDALAKLALKETAEYETRT